MVPSLTGKFVFLLWIDGGNEFESMPETLSLVWVQWSFFLKWNRQGITVNALKPFLNIKPTSNINFD